MKLMVEHHIQREILGSLMREKALRFSELKPAGMESNIFMYHLKQLIKDGYVAKVDDRYQLVHKGLQYVDGLSSASKRPRQQPKIVTILVINNEGKYLLAERKLQPYIGQRMFPSGKQHMGESLADHVERETREKFGRTLPMTYRGIANIRINQDGKVLTHILAHVHSTDDKDVHPPETDRFRFVWHDFDVDGEILMPGTKELYKQLIKSSEPFILDLDV